MVSTPEQFNAQREDGKDTIASQTSAPKLKLEASNAAKEEEPSDGTDNESVVSESSETTQYESSEDGTQVCKYGSYCRIPLPKKARNAKAYVSRVADLRLSVHSITIGKEFVQTSYQDSCATHNFLSPEYSRELVKIGYAIYKCSPMEVEQGTILENPTTWVHFLQLTMISPAGDIVRWDNCLFLVAEVGADVLIGNPILEIGNIMKYKPPDGYQATLVNELWLHRAEPRVSATEAELAKRVARRIKTYQYQKPTEVKHNLPERFLNAIPPKVLATSIQGPIPVNSHRLNLVLTEPMHEGDPWTVYWEGRWPLELPIALRQDDGLRYLPVPPLFPRPLPRRNLHEMEEEVHHRERHRFGLPWAPFDWPGRLDVDYHRIPVDEENPVQIDNQKGKEPEPGANLKDIPPPVTILDALPPKDRPGIGLASKEEPSGLSETRNFDTTPDRRVRIRWAPSEDGPRVRKRFLDHIEGEGGCSEANCPTHATCQNRYRALALKTQADMDHKKLLRTQACQEKKDAKERANMETKWGRDPPHPLEIMQALDILKTLSEQPPEKIFDRMDLHQIKSKLSIHRPEWAKTLTRAHTDDVYDAETKTIIEDLMDNRFRKSVFIKSLRIPCDFRQFDIPQKEGYDDWPPPQPVIYRCPAMAEVVNTWQDGLQDDELIKPSIARRPARVTVVHKDGRDDRVCVDYRNRNLRSIVPVFPMPQIQDHLDEAIGFKFYCSFDCSKMFNQFEITEQYRHLAAFITHRGVYEPNRIMFGLQGGPQHAVRELTTEMLKDTLTNGTMYTEWALLQNQNGETPPYEIDPSLKIVKGSRLRPFVDDVKVMSNHLKGMFKLVELFFQFCEKHHLVLSRKKAKVCVTHLKLLGMVVSEKGKHLDPDRIISLLDAPLPRSREGLHSLLCSYNFVRMFVPNFASLAAPLYNACKGIIWKGPGSGKSKGTREVDPEFVWSQSMSRAYEQLRNTLLEAPILVAPNWNHPLFLSVDASLKGEGWCLWQLIPTESGKLIPVAILYGSTKYTATEAAWEVTRQEVSAMRSAIVDVQDYVFGQHFYLFSDHRNLAYMHNSVNRAVIRIRHFLSQFNMTVIHCPGIWNNPADGISRIEGPMTTPIPYVPSIYELQEGAECMNSAESAKLKEDTFFISRGTDMGTQQEFTYCPDKTDTVLTVNKERKSIQTGSSLSSAHAREAEIPQEQPANAHVLFSKCSDMGGSCPLSNCWLCQTEEPDLLSDDTREDHHSPLCFKTQLLERVSDTVIKDTGATFDDDISWVIKSLCCQTGTIEIEMVEYYVKEAELWNTNFQANLPLLRPSILEVPVELDTSDIDDAEWCGPVDRKVAQVFLARGSGKRKLHEKNMRTLTKSGLYSVEQAEKALRISVREKDLMEEDLAVALQWLIQNTQGIAALTPVIAVLNPLERITLETQTTPADFRAVGIRVPMKRDFMAIHNNESGHHGVDYSFRKLFILCGSKWANERGTATKVRKELKHFIDTCPICQKVRGLHCKISAKHSFIVSRPFLEASYDFIVFDKPDKNGKRYILVFIDNFTKLVELKATKSRDAISVAKFLICIKSRYGPVARLRSDKAAEFIGIVITKLNESSGTSTCPCIAYHPQANSICERQNGIVMYHLRCLCYGCKLGPETSKTWSDLLPFIFSIVNSTPKLPLTISPLSMIYGVFANYDRPIIRKEFLAQGNTSNSLDYFEALCSWQVELLEAAETIQEEHLNKLAVKFHLEESTERIFNEGDFVLQLKISTSLKGKSIARWTGPKLVAQRRENDPSHPVVDLIDLTTMKVTEASIEDCRLFQTGWFDNDTLLPDLTKLASLDREEYEVERIISHKPIGEERSTKTAMSKYSFEVKWLDFPDSENSWEPYNSLKDNCTAPLGIYSDLHPGLRIPKELTPAPPVYKRTKLPDSQKP